MKSFRPAPVWLTEGPYEAHNSANNAISLQMGTLALGAALSFWWLIVYRFIDLFV